MKKIILSFALVFIMNFGLNALAEVRLEDLAEQTGCQSYCDSAKTCCQEKNIGRISQIAGNCDEQHTNCITTHQTTPSDQCPEIESCD